MPKHNNPGVVQRLRDFMGAKGDVGIDTIAPELVPVVLTADVSEQAKGVTPVSYFMGTGVAGATAANYSHVGIFNPASSPVDVMVDRAFLACGSLQAMSIRVYAAPQTGLTPSGNLSVVDQTGITGFVMPSVAPYAIVNQGDHTSLYGAIYIFRAPVQYNAMTFVPLNVRLTPGNGIVASPLAANQQCHGTYWWREVRRVP